METSDFKESARMRPRVERELAVPAARALQRIKLSLAESSCRIVGTVVERHVELYVRPRHRHFWSPWFSGELTPRASERALLHGRFGPHPALWTGFAAAYALCTFLALGSAVYGLAQLTLGAQPWSLLGVGLGGLLLVLLYAAARVGRSLAAEQIGWMVQLLDCSLDGSVSCAQARCAACPLWSGREEAAAALHQRHPPSPDADDTERGPSEASCNEPLLPVPDGAVAP